jgi:predicted dehydrogenase
MDTAAATADPVVTAVAGLGGYAGQIIDRLLLAEGAADHPPRLSAVTSSDPGRHPDLVARLEKRGVAICSDYASLLAREDVEAVWLPVPIDLHLPFVEQALGAGKAVMCEKPVAGTVDECDRMIALRDRYGLPVNIGYQSMYDPASLWLKRRLLAGAIGRVVSATVHAVWPRDTSYYGRASWAGRLRRNGSWVLDSPLQNAFNHFPNLMLFLLGRTEEVSAVPEAVEAEAYRVHDIESYDTISVRLRLDTGAEAIVLLTHAGQVRRDPFIQITGEEGTASWQFDREARVQPESGTPEIVPVLDVWAQRDSMIAAFDRGVRGAADPDRMVATLEHGRAILVAVNGVAEAAPVHPVPAGCYRTVVQSGGAELRVIPRIDEVFARCVRTGQMLHESGEFPWTVPGRSADLSGYDHFSRPYGWEG